MSRRTWTYPELRRVVAAIESGRTWAEVAADYGRSASTLCELVQRHNVPYDLSKRPPTVYKRANLVRRAIVFRSTEGASWAATADHVGWPRSVAALRKAAQCYMRRHGGTVSTRAPAP